MHLFPHLREERVLLRAVAATILLSALLPRVAVAASPANSLQSVEQKLDEAKKREQELGRQATEAERKLAALRQRSVAVAAGIQEHEATILTLEDKLGSLENERKKVEASLEGRREQLAGMLAALQRIAMHPPVALIALPMKPVDTVRSALLLRSTVPAVQALGHTLREDLDALDDIKQAVLAARTKIKAERRTLEGRRATLAKLTAQKTEMVRSARSELRETRERATRLGKEAHDLRDLIARLAKHRIPHKARRAAPRTPVVATPHKGEKPSPLAGDGLPVRGRITRLFGAKNEFGERSRGVLISTEPKTTVVAPRDGDVVFAGPFRGLGNLLIIRYHAKYHLLLAGLARIDTEVGEKVLAGEPVGVMQSSGDRNTALYMELRRNGQPINPLPWLAAGRTRVNG